MNQSNGDGNQNILEMTVAWIWGAPGDLLRGHKVVTCSTLFKFETEKCSTKVKKKNVMLRLTD